MPSRLETFRDYMARLDAAANPARALARGFYVERPGRSAAGEIAARLALRPASSHLLVGGVGSGKTTQLLVALDLLNNVQDTWAKYLDVSEHQDIGRMQPGILIVLAGLAVGEALVEDTSEEVVSLKQQFERWAHGYWADPFAGYSEGFDDVWVKGLLSPAGGELHEDVKDKAQALNEIHAALARRAPHQILLIDSLDRLSNSALFEEIAEQDIRAIRSIGIGVAVAGPLRSMYGIDRPIADRFDYFYHQSPVDAQEDSQGRSFLVDVLRARLPSELLPEISCLSLADWSGGVLRDLITLAQAACEEAYFHGTDQITSAEVGYAVAARGTPSIQPSGRSWRSSRRNHERGRRAALPPSSRLGRPVGPLALHEPPRDPRCPRPERSEHSLASQATAPPARRDRRDPQGGGEAGW